MSVSLNIVPINETTEQNPNGYWNVDFVFTSGSNKCFLYLRHHDIFSTVKPVLNGTAMDQNIFPLKPGFRLIKTLTYLLHGAESFLRS
jgi:hypothetical protein